MYWRGGLLAGLVGLLATGCAAPVEETATVRPSALPAPTATPTDSPTPVLTPEAVPKKEGVGTVTFSIVYDNNAHAGVQGHDPALQTAWGFACVMETDERTVLFDTGGSSQMLLGNMEWMGVDPNAIDAVVLSHEHGDHVGGLPGLLDLGVTPTVYVPTEFAPSFKDRVRARTALIEVSTPTEVLPGMYATGRVGSGIVEQALVVETAEGLVVVTGCAHPGVVAMVRRAKEILPGEVALLMGGFHLGDASASQVEGIVADFRQLGVRQVAPCHCTGDRAREIFAVAYGESYFAAGVGWVMSIEPPEEEG